MLYFSPSCISFSLQQQFQLTYEVHVVFCPNSVFTYTWWQWIEMITSRFAWVAQLVKCLTWAQVMISWFLSSSPMWGSVLTSRSLPGIISLPLFLPLPCLQALSFSKINKTLKKKKEGDDSQQKDIRNITRSFRTRINKNYCLLLRRWPILQLIAFLFAKRIREWEAIFL